MYFLLFFCYVAQPCPLYTFLLVLILSMILTLIRVLLLCSAYYELIIGKLLLLDREIGLVQ